MNFAEQSYSGKIFRPRPITHTDEAQSLFVVATPWGSRELGEEFVNQLSHFYVQLMQDTESTTPFEINTNWSMEQNNLRTSLLLTHQSLYKQNEKEYVLGLEILVGVITGNNLSWVQVGNPSLFLARNEEITTLSASYDLEFELSNKVNLPPLPSQLIGIEKSLSFELKSIHLQPEDQIILYSGRSHNLNSINYVDANDLVLLTRTLSSKSPLSPFWIAHLNL